jgi:Zn-dependent peptidase ImmA (M78 family)
MTKSEKIIQNLSIKRSGFLFGIWGKFDYMVWGRKRIFTKTYSDEDFFTSLLDDLKTDQITWTGGIGAAYNKGKRFDFCHELGHIIQGYKYSFIRRAATKVADIFRKYQNRPYEVAAEAFAHVAYKLPPRALKMEIKKELENRRSTKLQALRTRKLKELTSV